MKYIVLYYKLNIFEYIDMMFGGKTYTLALSESNINNLYINNNRS